MANIDNISHVHPLRLEWIRMGKCRSCESCQHSQYQSGTEEGVMEFRGCDVIVGITNEPMRCSKFCLDAELIDEEEAAHYAEKGIRWDQGRLL